jgi:predicted dinucleotide-binding enzyme
MAEAVADAAVIVVATPDPAFRALPRILDARDDVIVFDCWRLLDGLPVAARVIGLGQGVPA